VANSGTYNSIAVFRKEGKMPRVILSAESYAKIDEALADHNTLRVLGKRPANMLEVELTSSVLVFLQMNSHGDEALTQVLFRLATNKSQSVLRNRLIQALHAN
jgi:hypothetical protein